MLNKISEVIDIYTIKPKLFINNREGIPSKTGAFLSLITIITSIGIIVFLLKEYFDRETYSIAYTKEFRKSYELNLLEKNLYFGMFSWNKEIMTNIDRIINFTVNQVYKNPDNKDIYKSDTSNLFLEKCNKTEFFLKNQKLLPKNFSDMNLWCLNSKNKNITIKGKRNDDKDSSFINLHFLRCINSTDNESKCLDEKTIDDYLKQMYFVWGSQDFDMNHDSFESPLNQTYFIEAQTFTSINDTIFEFLIKFKQLFYKSDSGMFLKEFKTYSQAIHDETEMLLIERSDRQEIFNVLLQTSGIREIYTRRYQKIQEALSQISAMLNIVKTILGFIVMNLVGEKIYFEQLINHLFSYDEVKITQKKEFLQLKNKLFDESKNLNNDLKNKKEKVNTKKDINSSNEMVNNIAKNENSKTIQFKTNTNEIQKSEKQLMDNSSFLNLLKESRKSQENKLSFRSSVINEKENVINELGRSKNNNLKISNFEVENAFSKVINEEKPHIEAAKEKSSFFEITFRDYLCAKFARKRADSFQVFQSFMNSVKNILSIELLMTEIIDFSETNNPYALEKMRKQI